MKLYVVPGACSLSCHIALEESGLKYQWEKIDVKNKTVASGDYLKINSKGQVPALQLDNGEVLTEGAVISQYIADQAPQKHLVPQFGTWERYRAMEWMNYVATEIHKGDFGSLFSADHWIANQEGRTQLKASAHASLATKFKTLNTHFTQNQFLMGNHFTIADAYLFTCLRWAHGVKADLTPYPAIMGFFERVQTRPAVAKVLKDEGLT